MGDLPGANLFNYITFRAGGATMTALLISFILGPWMINTLRNRQSRGQPIRADGPQSHLTTKVGTPTMGGLLILLASIGSTLLWGNLQNIFLWIALLTTLSFGLIGFADDYSKLRGHSSDGAGARQACVGIADCHCRNHIHQRQSAARIGDQLCRAVFQRPAFAVRSSALFDCRSDCYCRLIKCGQSDRRAGRAGYCADNDCRCQFRLYRLSRRQCHFRQLSASPLRAGHGRVGRVLCCAYRLGSGFLWYNAPPAAVFMGDTGSLALGAALGTIAIITKHELVLAIIGGLFVLEAVSVIVQVASFKLTGKRVFAMAPLHHHFEQRGWAESTIVIRFWIISVVLALVGLATLKLR